jgi:hypothetical protein
MMYSNVIYGFSMPFIKASIVFTLNRITTTQWHRWGLYGMLFMATIMAIVGILATLLYCHPLPAYWNPLLGTCGDFMVVVRIGYAWTAIGIVTDWTCAILPYFIVRNLQMSSRHKLIVMLILGLGAVASTATIIRAPYLKYYLVTEDRLCKFDSELLASFSKLTIQNPQTGTVTSLFGVYLRVASRSSLPASQRFASWFASMSILLKTALLARATVMVPDLGLSRLITTPRPQSWTHLLPVERRRLLVANGSD